MEQNPPNYTNSSTDSSLFRFFFVSDRTSSPHYTKLPSKTSNQSRNPMSRTELPKSTKLHEHQHRLFRLSFVSDRTSSLLTPPNSPPEPQTGREIQLPKPSSPNPPTYTNTSTNSSHFRFSFGSDRTSSSHFTKIHCEISNRWRNPASKTELSKSTTPRKLLLLQLTLPASQPASYCKLTSAEEWTPSSKCCGPT